MKWTEYDEHTRKLIVDNLRSSMAMERVSRCAPHRGLAEAHFAAAEALEDVARFQDMYAEHTRIHRELAIASAARCYHRCLSRVAQAKLDPDARAWLLKLAIEARTAGDDIMKEAGMDPSEHPLAERMRVRRDGFVFDLVKWPEWEREAADPVTTEALDSAAAPAR